MGLAFPYSWTLREREREQVISMLICKVVYIRFLSRVIFSLSAGEIVQTLRARLRTKKNSHKL